MLLKKSILPLSEIRAIITLLIAGGCLIATPVKAETLTIEQDNLIAQALCQARSEDELVFAILSSIEEEEEEEVSVMLEEAYSLYSMPDSEKAVFCQS